MIPTMIASKIITIDTAHKGNNLSLRIFLGSQFFSIIIWLAMKNTINQIIIIKHRRG